VRANKKPARELAREHSSPRWRFKRYLFQVYLIKLTKQAYTKGFAVALELEIIGENRNPRQTL
jgi:hypothetical protein